MADKHDGKVGYCRPPAEHRFKPGQSGNPRGRPKKQKVPKGQGLDLGTQPANQLLMEEAYRLVTLREGERVTQLPAIQAVFRAMNVAALKGNRFAQRTFAELVQGVEDADRQLRSDYFAAAIDYKAEWERAIHFAQEQGRPEPSPIPHPDDIIVDLRTGAVHTNGPSTKEEKARWDKLLARRDEAQELVTDYAELQRRARSAKNKEFYRRERLFEQQMFDRLNGNLPARYRKVLIDRLRDEGASRESDFTTEWPGER